MATEELGVKVSVEGFSEFQAAFKRMDGIVDEAADSFADLSAQSQKTGRDLTSGAQGTDKLKLSLTDLKSGIDMAVGAMRTVAQVAQQAFEFAQEGAAINATADSFNRLGISIDALRAASFGTISDMDLMASTLTLMAGASGETGDAFGAAMPQLLAMAKAANTLNPTMGDTAFMLDSITKAVKRQSVEIADNLGIIVSTGPAYKEYAASIGKTVEQLTDQEKQMAYLNAILEAGNVLIEQAGGSAASAADGYAQLSAEIKNTVDEWKRGVDEGVTPFVNAMASHTKETRRAYDALGSGARTVTGMVILTDDLREAVVAQEQAQLAAANAVQQTVPTYEEYIAASYRAIAATNDGTGAWGDYDLNARLAQQSALAVAAAIDRTTETVMASTQAQNAYRAALDGAISNEMERFKQEQDGLIEKAGALNSKIAELEARKYLTGAQREELSELRSELEENNKAIQANIDKHEEATKRILLGYIEQRLALDGLTADELLALQKIANEWGLLDDATLQAMQSIDGYAGRLDAGRDSIDQFVARNSALADSLLKIPTLIDVRIRIATEGNIPTFSPDPGDPTVASAYQHGGTTPGGAFLAGEHGPELIRGIRGGAQVVSAPATARLLSQQNSVTNNFNLTTNAMTRPSGLALEFAAMEMGSR